MTSPKALAERALEPSYSEAKAWINFWSSVTITRKCWLWNDSLDNKNGYGVMYNPILRKTELAHRSSYRLFKGHISPGLVIHHTCYERRCVNPAHLAQITNKENVLDVGSKSISAINSRKTKCKNGHPYAGPSGRILYRKNGTKTRYCAICKLAGNRARRQKNESG